MDKVDEYIDWRKTKFIQFELPESTIQILKEFARWEEARRSVESKSEVELDQPKEDSDYSAWDEDPGLF